MLDMFVGSHLPMILRALLKVGRQWSWKVETQEVISSLLWWISPPSNLHPMLL